MRWRSAAAALALLLASQATAAGQGRDPRLTWRTVRTRHFEIHYHEPLGMVARRVAGAAERVHATLAPLLDHWPSERTQVVLSDDADSANASANAVPYNTIRLFATGPEDLAPLSDYDDWLTELITHEHTHVLHLDTISGIPALINAIFGKVYPPNSVQPRWFLEGLAVHEESSNTSAGRLRSSMFDMFMRMDALEGCLLRLDQISHSVDRWPHGNVPYLYGAFFVRYIADQHGHEALTRISHEYGGQVIAFGMNRVARRATGRTFVELYDDFIEHTRQHYGEMAQEVRSRGLREGVRITHNGEMVRSPRFVDRDHVVFGVADGVEHGQLRIVEAATGAGGTELARVAGMASPAPHPAGEAIYLSGLDTHLDTYFYYDLFRYDRQTGETARLTHGMRAVEPDVSPDGRRLAFTVNGAATTHLAVADLSDITRSRRILVRSRRYEQVFTPKWSPDGTTIAFSAWRAGGFRDIALVDVRTGRQQLVTHDRAQDTGPEWSPDGRLLYFSSDRTGIANIYAHDTTTGLTSRVTNVLGGAYQPTISPDGERLVYVGYTSDGFDLYSMRLDPASFARAEPYEDDRPPPVPEPESLALGSETYNPVPTLLPHAYLVELGEDGFGRQLALTFDGGDVVGFHSYAGRMGVGLERGNLNLDLSWTYHHSLLPVTFRLFRTIAPRGGLFVAGERRTWIEEAMGGEVGLSYSLPAAFHFESVSLGYTLAHLDKAEPFGGRLDPNDPPPTVPQMGVLAALRFGWYWSDAVRTAFDVTPSEGGSLQLNMSVAHPLLGSQFQAASMTWAVTRFFENPWVEHHVLALRYAGGISGGDLGRRGIFSVGGYPDTNLLDAVLDNIVLVGSALRGYAPFDRSGTQFHLMQAEYRFPILRVERGLGTFPFYVDRLWALAFADCGDAFFGDPELDTFRFGVGGELLTEMTLGYYLAMSMRVGLARGLSEGGKTQLYVNMGFPF